MTTPADPKRHDKYLEQRRGLRTLLARLGDRPAGFSTADVSGYTVDAVAREVVRLVAEGVLFRAKISHRVMRLFCDQVRAAEYERQNKRGASPTAAGITFNGRKSGRGRAPWSDDAPPVFTAATKFTYGKPFPEGVLKTNTHWKF